MYDAYHRIFTRCGLTFRAVEADTGLIGGSSSHEFMVLAETGENTIVYSDTGTYAANIEQAEVLPPTDINTEVARPLRSRPNAPLPHRRRGDEIPERFPSAPCKNTPLFDRNRHGRRADTGRP